MENNKRIKAMIVEQHALMRERLGNLLTSWEYEITQQLPEYVELPGSSAKQPDICIVGIDAPPDNACDLIRKLKNEFPATRTLLLSMNADPSINYANRSGADAQLSKTASLFELKNVLFELATMS